MRAVHGRNSTSNALPSGILAAVPALHDCPGTIAAMDQGHKAAFVMPFGGMLG